MSFSIKWAEAIAKKYGMKVSDDITQVNYVLEGLNKTGKYCPCVPKYLHNNDTICPCANMRSEKECHCGIFQKI